MKTYSGYRAAEEDYASDNFVFVSENGVDRPMDLAPSLRVRNHSPTGFNWGYGGSGPHQLALAILLDFTGNQYLSESLYQRFVLEFVRGLDDKWELSGDTLQAWIDKNKLEFNE